MEKSRDAFVAEPHQGEGDMVDLDFDPLDAGSRLRWQCRNKCLPAEAIVKEGVMNIDVELFGKKISFIPNNKEELDYLKSKMKK